MVRLILTSEAGRTIPAIALGLPRWQSKRAMG